MTATETDERQGLPSASSMARTLACPAWVSRSVGLETPEKQWTRDGTKMHAVLAGEEDDEDLSDELDLAVGICRNKAEMLLASIGFEEYETITETRLWITDDSGNRIGSAKPDKVFIEKDHFAIFDFKTGRKDVPAPSMNPQLVTCAIAVAQTYGITKGFLGIVPAWRQTPPVAEIGGEQIEQWRQAIIAATRETAGPTPRAQAGPHCDYCPARADCPEAWEIVRRVDAILADFDIMNDSPETTVANYDLAKHAEGTINVFLESVKARLKAEPGCFPGLEIGKGGETKTIPGGLANYERLTSLYSPAVVLAACKWTPAALAKVISPGKGTKAAQKALEEELSDMIVRKEKAGSIERV